MREQLVKNLQRIEENEYLLNADEQLWDYVTLMLQFIGDPQPELRDELIYPTFYKWIYEKQWFNEAELRELLSIVLDDQHLLYHIGNKGDQTVFTRTFSVLVVALIIQRHRQQPFLDTAEFVHLKDSLIRYYKEEKDLRGYLDEEGWAHGAAHGADALEELVQCRESNDRVQLEVLDAVQGILYNGEYIFCDEDDERIATLVDTILNEHLLPHSTVSRWIAGLDQCLSWPRSRSQYVARVNAKNLLRSLYFRWIHNKYERDVLDNIQKTEVRLNKFHKIHVVNGIK